MVQDFGLNLLVRQERLDRREAKEDALRRALVAAGGDPTLIFPEVFPKPPAEETDLEQDEDLFQEDVEYDYTAVKPEDPANFERDQAAMLDALMRADHMVMTENPDWY